MILWGTVSSTLERIKYRSTPLRLDPKEASLNGDIGGVISLGRVFKKGDVLKVVLRNERATTTYHYNSDRERSTRVQTDLMWEDEGLVQVEKIDGKLCIQFLFQMNNHEKKFATQSRGEIIYYWELLISHKEIGFYRTFIIPVKKGSLKSKNIKRNTSKTLPKGVRNPTISSLIPLLKKGDGYSLIYPSFYNTVPLIAFGVFGSLFSLVGGGVLLFGEEFFLRFLGTIFFTVSSGLILFGLYQTVVTRKIYYTKEFIIEEKYLFGVKFLNKRLAINQESKIVFLDLALTKRDNELNNFSSIAIESQGAKIVLANHIESIKEQKKIKEYFERYFELR